MDSLDKYPVRLYPFLTMKVIADHEESDEVQILILMTVQHFICPVQITFVTLATVGNKIGTHRDPFTVLASFFFCSLCLI